MKIKFIVINVLLLFALSFPLFSQQNVVKVIGPEIFHLNSTSNTFWSGGKNRICYIVQLPLNSKGFYYSVSTSKQGGVNLDLFAQLSKYYDITGTTSNVINSLSSPTGTSLVNVFMTNKNEASNFEKGLKFSYNDQYSRERLTNGVVHVDLKGGGKIYFCFENPSTYNGMSVTFEVVAITDK